MSHPLLSRKRFLHRTVIVGLSCPLAKALFASSPEAPSSSGRTPLNLNSINQMAGQIFVPQRILPGARMAPSPFREKAIIAQRDWRELLAQEFRLNAQQVSGLKAMPDDQVQLIQDAINEAARSGKPLVFRPGAGSGGDPQAAAIGCTTKCTFDKTIKPDGTVIIHRECSGTANTSIL